MSDKWMCNRCGLSTNGKFCARCGYSMEQAASPSPIVAPGSFEKSAQVSGIQKTFENALSFDNVKKLSEWSFGIGSAGAVLFSTMLPWSTEWGGRVHEKGMSNYAWGKVMFFVSILQIIAFLFIKFRESTDEVRVKLDFAHGVIAAAFLLGVVISGSWVNSDSRSIGYGFPIAVLATLFTAATAGSRIYLARVTGAATTKTKVVRVEVPTPQAPVQASADNASTAEALQKFFDLKVSGAISDEEYEAQKKKILGL